MADARGPFNSDDVRTQMDNLEHRKGCPLLAELLEMSPADAQASALKIRDAIGSSGATTNGLFIRRTEVHDPAGYVAEVNNTSFTIGELKDYKQMQLPSLVEFHSDLLTRRQGGTCNDFST